MNNCEKCGYYSDGECNICGMGISGEDTFCRLCKDNPNCYYKQLSELKAENTTYKANADAVHKYITQNEQLKTHISSIEKKNAKLNAIIDGYQPKIQALKDENKQLKELFEIESLTDIKTGETMYRSRQIIHFVDILQEIKEIAEALSCKHPEDCWENTPDWNGEVYGCDVADNWKEPSELATCPSKLASAILQIITKAEEEWK